MKYWLRLWEINQTNSSGDALGQKEREENNWMGRIKQELERMGMRDIWKHERTNIKNIWVRTT
jgi:hypothetical protein